MGEWTELATSSRQRVVLKSIRSQAQSISPRTLVSPSPRFGATITKTPLKATTIPNVFGTERRSPGIQKVRKESR